MTADRCIRAGVAATFAAGLAAAAALAGIPAAAATARMASVHCPAAASTAPANAPGAVQWEFSQLGPPTPASASGSSSWTRGAGTWTAGRAAGTICTNDSGGTLASSRDLVLAVAGSSKLTPKITRFGLLGVGLVVPVKVSASDDAACPAGATGSVTLFASYYSVHHDSVALSFASGCSDHDHTFTGAQVHILIASDGHQVDSAP
ncbi:MAG: hypothetical protein ABR947_09390 [Solirubrobacteraceae bacterium]